MKHARTAQNLRAPETRNRAGTPFPSMMLFAPRSAETLADNPETTYPRSRRRATWRSSAARRASHAPPTEVIHEMASPSGAGVGR